MQTHRHLPLSSTEYIPAAQFLANVILAHLNGLNGFSIIGFSASDWSYGGFSVKTIGDINVDGIADIAIGAPYTSKYLGAAYVIFAVFYNNIILKDFSMANSIP